MNKKNAKIILYIVSVFLVLLIVILIINKREIRADSNLGSNLKEKEFNLVLNDKKFRFIIKSYSLDGNVRNYLLVKKFFKTKQVELPGFENDLNLCNKPTLKFNDREIICLTGEVGVHSKALSFFEQGLSIVKINDHSVIKKFITTDSPSYQILDFNNDGYDDLIIDNRNYDKNPLVDIHRVYYSGSNVGFIFDKVECVEVK